MKFKKLHPALKANVEPVENIAEQSAGGELTPATPSVDSGKEPEPEPEPEPESEGPTRAEVRMQLKKLGIPFDGRASLEELQTLLPK
ncbi:TPA: hypothetical protein ACGTRQ_003552 [Vibrio parahaemolyticus]